MFGNQAATHLLCSVRRERSGTGNNESRRRSVCHLGGHRRRAALFPALHKAANLTREASKEATFLVTTLFDLFARCYEDTSGVGDVHTFFSCSLFALSFFTNLLMVTFGNIAVLWLFPLDKNNALGLFATLNERWQVERWQRSALVTCLPSLAQGFAGGRSYREMRRDFTSAPKVANNHTEKHCSYLPFVAFDKSRCGGLKSRQIHRHSRQLGIAACLVEASWFELRRPEKTSVSATATICPFLIVSAVGSIRFLTTASKTSHNCTVLINCWSGFTEELPIVCEGLFPPFGQSGSLVAVSLHCITKYIVHSHILPTSAFLDYTLTMSWHSFVSEIFKDFFSF